jgi:hypothetical protein
MGCGSSAAKDAPASEPEKAAGNEADQVVPVAKKENLSPRDRKPGSKKKIKRRPSHRGMISKLALQFPIIKNSFDKVHSVFEEYHVDGLKGPKDMIRKDRLKDVLEHVGEHKKFTDEEVMELFHTADLDGSASISFKEFLIAIAMGYFLAVESDVEEFLEIQRGFKVVEKAFHDMDEDNGGSVDAEELKKALFASSMNDGTEVLEARLKELDFDGGGDISLPEFMYGMISWVGFQVILYFFLKSLHNTQHSFFSVCV